MVHTCPACKLVREKPRPSEVDLTKYLALPEAPVPCIVTTRQIQLHDVVQTWGQPPYGYGVVIEKTSDHAIVLWNDPGDEGGTPVRQTTYLIALGQKVGHLKRIEVDL